MITAAKTKTNAKANAAAVTKTNGNAHQRENIDWPRKMTIVVKKQQLKSH
jgi:hypothetical protein